MKMKTQIAAALLALGVVAQAGATDPVVYLTGSTAFRSTIFKALSASFPTNNPAGVFDSNTVTYVTYGNASAGSANYMVFHGNIAGAGVYVNCAWSGSEAGIASACNATLTNLDRNNNPIPLAGSPEAWLDVTKVTLNGVAYATNPFSTSGLFENNGVPFHGSDLAQADTSQAISWTPRVAGTPTDLHDFGVEGLVTFTWTRNINTHPSNAWVNCANVTLPQLNVLLAAGFVPASFFTGNTNDSNFNVYCVGRNLGSGTRMNVLGDSGYGAHTPVQQFSIGLGIEETPQTSSLILTNEGDNGYESGGGVAKALSIDGSCQQQDPFFGNPGWFALGYASPSDVINAGVTTNYWVTVDGVLSSNGSIENGQFWFWGHEHLYGKFGISGIQSTVGNTLFGAAVNTLALNGFGVDPNAHDPAIQTSLMHVSKASDTAFPSP